MNAVEMAIRDHPVESMMLGMMVAATMAPHERRILADALGKEPSWRDYLYFAYERSQYQEWHQTQQLKAAREQEKRDREIIRRLIWGSRD